MDGLTTDYKDRYINVLTQDKANEDTVIGYIIDNEDAALTAIKIINPNSFVYGFNNHIFNILKTHLAGGKTLSDVHATIASVADDDWKDISPNDKINGNKHLNNSRIKAVSLLGNMIGAEGLFKKINEQYLRRTLLDKNLNFVNSLLNTSGLSDVADVITEFTAQTNSALDAMGVQDSEQTYP